MTRNEKVGDTTYVAMTCIRCGHEKVSPSWKIASLLRDRQIVPEAWDYAAIGRLFRCSRCGAKSP